MSSRITSNDNDIKAIEAVNATQSTDISSNKASIEAIEAVNATQSTDIAKLKATSGDLSSRITSNDLDIEAIKTVNTTQDGKINTNTSNIAKIIAGTTGVGNADKLDGLHSTDFARSSTQVIAGYGLSGGGTLAASRTINVNTNRGISVADDYVGINTHANSGLAVGATLEVDITGTQERTDCGSSDVFLMESPSGNKYKVTRDNLLAGLGKGSEIRGTINPKSSQTTPITTLAVTGDPENTTISQGVAPNGAIPSGYTYVVLLDEMDKQTGVTIRLGGTFTRIVADFLVHDQDQIQWVGDNFIHLETGNAIISVHGRKGVVLAQSGDYTASQITNAPSGTLTSTNVQSALNELQTDVNGRLPLSGGTLTGGLTISAPATDNILKLYASQIATQETVYTSFYNNDGSTRWGYNGYSVHGETAWVFNNERGSSFNFRTTGGDKKGLIFNSNAVYHEGYKPTAIDVGALPLSGGTLTGTLNAPTVVTSDITIKHQGTASDTFINTGNTMEVGSTFYINNTSGDNIYGFTKLDTSKYDNVFYGSLYENNNRVYSAANKPTAAEVKAVSIFVATVTTQDWDTLTISGDYSVSNMTGANRPEGAYAFGVLRVANANSSWVQTYYPNSTGHISTRSKWGSKAWTEWTSIYTTDSKPTWEDVGGDAYFTKVMQNTTEHIQAKRSLRAWGDGGGFYPAIMAGSSNPNSYLGHDTGWFKEAWVAKYRGASVDVTGRIKGQIATTASIIDTRLPASNQQIINTSGSDLFIGNPTNVSKVYLETTAAGRLYHNMAGIGAKAIFTQANPPTAAEVKAVAKSGDSMTGPLKLLGTGAAQSLQFGTTYDAMIGTFDNYLTFYTSNAGVAKNGWKFRVSSSTAQGVKDAVNITQTGDVAAAGNMHAAGLGRFDNGVYVDGAATSNIAIANNNAYHSVNGNSSPNKYCLWGGDSNYTIGMTEAYEYGDVTAHATTFTMQRDTQGWLFRKSTDVTGQASMGLSAAGNMKLKGSITTTEVNVGFCTMKTVGNTVQFLV